MRPWQWLPTPQSPRPRGSWWHVLALLSPWIVPAIFDILSI